MIISARMIDIAKYLYQYRQTTYKEISQSLNIKERNIRYDIERINQILTEKGLSPIQKMSKGVLHISNDFSLDIFESVRHDMFIYSQEERTAIIRLLLLVNHKELKLSKLSMDLNVSRSTIKNDLEEVEKQYKKDGFEIVYEGHFRLQGDIKHHCRFMANELKRYISIIKHPTHINGFLEYILKILDAGFCHVSLKQVIKFIDDMLERSNRVLSDEIYNWYAASLLCMVWMHQHESIPLYHQEFLYRNLEIITPFLEQLEMIMDTQFTQDEKDKMTIFVNYMDLYVLSNTEYDVVNIEEIVTDFVAQMSLEMGVPFQNDLTLIEGLFNHIIPLAKRIHLRVVVEENVISLLSLANLEVYEIVTRVISNIELLDQITNENEIAYLAIHFIASLKRINQTRRKRILLICGHGYGTTTILKETLLNEYQVEIIDIIPKYKLSSYHSSKPIDLIITTMKLDEHINYLQVSPILTALDEKRLIEAGLVKRTILSNYYSFNNSLNFLTDEDRLKVLDVVRKELGYKEVNRPKKITKLSSLLGIEEIRVIDKEMTWEEAVIEGCEILENKGMVNRNYMESIFDSINQNGFYSVMDESFALLHGNSEKGVYRTGMSMIVNKQSVQFGDKKVNIIFCLSSVDQKEHIPAIIQLMKLQKTTEFINHVRLCNDAKEVSKILYQYEKRCV